MTVELKRIIVGGKGFEFERFSVDKNSEDHDLLTRTFRSRSVVTSISLLSKQNSFTDLILLSISAMVTRRYFLVVVFESV